MWNSKLGKQLSQVMVRYQNTKSCLGTTRQRVMKTAFLDFLENWPRLKEAVLEELSVYGETHPFGGLVRKLCDSQICVMCKTCCVGYGQTYLCRICGETPSGKKLRKALSTAKLKDYWTKNYDEALQKQIETSRKKFGTDYPWQSQRVQTKKRKQSLERTGLAHHFHNPEIRLKQQKASMRIKEVVVAGKLFLCQGYEPFVLKAAANKYGVADVIGQFEKGFEPLDFDPPYFPDFYIPSRDLYVEVKSSWTLMSAFERNRGLAEQAHDEDIELRWVVVYPKQKRIVTLPTDWWTWSRRKVERFLKNGVSGDQP